MLAHFCLAIASCCNTVSLGKQTRRTAISLSIREIARLFSAKNKINRTSNTITSLSVEEFKYKSNFSLNVAFSSKTFLKRLCRGVWKCFCNSDFPFVLNSLHILQYAI